MVLTLMWVLAPSLGVVWVGGGVQAWILCVDPDLDPDPEPQSLVTLQPQDQVQPRARLKGNAAIGSFAPTYRQVRDSKIFLRGA